MEEPEVGARLGRYFLEETLGSGAMGTVFRAVRDDGLVVALKVTAPELAADAEFRRRFERESRIAASLSHPHVVSVVEASEAGGHLFLASRFVRGRTLEQRIDEEGVLVEGEVVRIVSQIGGALDVLHERELVHRDVKPANIMLEEGDGALLADFGLARGASDTVLTQEGRVSGTVDYLAPEVIRGTLAGPAADIYALGCVAYACLSGGPPFAGLSLADAILAHLESMPDALESPLSEAVLQALAKSPDDRPPTATAYALMLRVSVR